MGWADEIIKQFKLNYVVRTLWYLSRPRTEAMASACTTEAITGFRRRGSRHFR